jgi:signal transduction histidine kinase
MRERLSGHGLESRQIAYDTAVALGMTAISVTILVSLTRRAAPWALGTATPLMVLHSACLVGRRMWPVPVVALQIATGLGVAAVGVPPEVLGLAILIGVYTVGAYRPVRVSLPTLGAAELAMFVAQWLSRADPDASTIVGNAIVMAAAWFLGNSVYSRRVYAEQLERRNEELEAARDELARSVVIEERLRIARELHDVIGHSMGTIAVQSGVGAHVIDDDPAAAKRALETIESTSKTALTEIRRLLGVLRENGHAPDRDPAPRAQDIEALVGRIAQGGPEVDLQMFGDLADLPPGMGLTVYRIVQEALTNVVKHANSKRARVVVTRNEDDVRVEIVDDGSGPLVPADGGHGLIGMRERVELFGGALETGPLPDGGFRVAARLPLGAAG